MTEKKIEKKEVVIEIHGGFPYVMKKPKGIIVVFKDYDYEDQERPVVTRQ